MTETPATATERIFFPENTIYEKNASKIRMTWDRTNLTRNVQISLWGYEEDTISRPKLEYMDMIDANVANSGEYIIDTDNYRHSDISPELVNIKIGFIQINMTTPEIVNGVQISP